MTNAYVQLNTCKHHIHIHSHPCAHITYIQTYAHFHTWSMFTCSLTCAHIASTLYLYMLGTHSCTPLTYTHVHLQYVQSHVPCPFDLFCAHMLLCTHFVAHMHALLTYEPPCGKTNNVVSEQVRYKPACTSIEKS